MSSCVLVNVVRSRRCFRVLPAAHMHETPVFITCANFGEDTVFTVVCLCLSVCLSVGRMTQSHCCICTNWGTMCIREEPTNDYLCVESVWNNIQDILSYIY